MGAPDGDHAAGAAGASRRGPGGPGGQGDLPGASSTALVPAQVDTPLSFEAMAAVGSAVGAGGFAVYDQSTCVLEPALLFCRFLHVESCAHCPPCKLNSGDVVEFLEALQRGIRRPTSPRGLLLPRIEEWDEEAGRFTYDGGYARKRSDWAYA